MCNPILVTLLKIAKKKCNAIKFNVVMKMGPYPA